MAALLTSKILRRASLAILAIPSLGSCRGAGAPRLDGASLSATGGTCTGSGGAGGGNEAGSVSGGTAGSKNRDTAGGSDAGRRGGDCTGSGGGGAGGGPGTGGVRASGDAAAGDSSTPSPSLYDYDESLVPPCHTNVSSQPQLGRTVVASDVAVLDVYDPWYVLVVSLPSSHLMSLTWQGTNVGVPWLPWYCFDVLVNPDRVAGMNLANHEMEVFATAAGGRLMYRRFYNSQNYWTPWMPLFSPTEREDLSDLTVLGGSVPALFVTTRSSVYARRLAAPDGPLGHWRNLKKPGQVRMAVDTTAAGTERAWAADAQGRLSVVEGALSDATGAPPPWHRVPGPANVVDIAAGRALDASRHLYALDATGTVWDAPADSLEAAAPLDAGPVNAGDGGLWAHVIDSPAVTQLASLTVGTHAGEAPLLVGVGKNGVVYDAEAPYTAWISIP